KIDGLLDRKPSQLSGGQMQRVAIARALVKDADIILMDEPLSNLDAQVRVIAREELKQLQRNIKPTILYVTHDQIEALSLASKLAILHDGVVQAYGDPMEIYKSPNNVWVGTFLGNPPMNVLKGEVDKNAIFVENGKIQLSDKFKFLVKDSQRVIVGVRPEDLSINENGTIEGTVEMIENLGSYSIIHVRLVDTTLRVLEKSTVKREKGDKVKILVDPNNINLFDPNDQRNLLVGKT
ncbi:ABC transporter ATP-binding protein, partial [Sulfolobus sp. F1]